jgi:hypothetical protein
VRSLHFSDVSERDKRAIKEQLSNSEFGRLRHQ